MFNGPFPCGNSPDSWDDLHDLYRTLVKDKNCVDEGSYRSLADCRAVETTRAINHYDRQVFTVRTRHKTASHWLKNLVPFAKGPCIH